MTFDPKVVDTAKPEDHPNRNLAYVILAVVLSVLTVGSLWVAGVFSGPSSYSCNIRVSQMGSNLVISLKGTKIDPSACAAAVKQSQTAKGAAVTQVTAVPAAYKLVCSGDEPASNGQVTVQVYSDGGPFSNAVSDIYCGQLDKNR